MRAVLAVLLIASLAAAGCGGDDEPAPTTSPRTTATGPGVTKEDYVRAADQVCKRGKAEIAKLNARLAQIPGSVAEGEQFSAIEPLIREAAEIERRYLRELQALDTPAADARAIDAILDAYGEQVRLVGEVVKAGISRELNNARERSRGLARRYGFAECGRG